MKVIAQTDLREIREETKPADPRDELIKELALQVAGLNIKVAKLEGGKDNV